MKPFNGIIQVTGEHDTGKTTFALECGVPAKQIVFFDDDVKGKSVVDDLGPDQFGQYHNLVAAGQGKTELEFYQHVWDLIDKIPPDTGAIIFDTWTRYSKTMHAYVVANPGNFRKNYAPMGSIKGAQQWQDTRRLEAEILTQLLGRAPLVILIAHLKSNYLNQIKTGKMEPDSSPTLERVARLRLWLRQNPTGGPVPIALVLKRMDEKQLTAEGHIRTVSILPRKLVPVDGENSLWDTINRYRTKPVGNRIPFLQELPDEYEMAILDGTLTADQQYVMRETLRLGLVRPEDEVLTEAKTTELPEQIQALIDDRSLSPVQVVKTALEHGTTMTPAEVIRWRKR